MGITYSLQQPPRRVPSKVFRLPEGGPHLWRNRPTLTAVILLCVDDLVMITGRSRASFDRIMNGAGHRLLFLWVSKLAWRYRGLGVEPLILVGDRFASGPGLDYCWALQADGFRVCDRGPGRGLWEDILELERGDGVLLHPGTFPLARESGIRLLIRRARMLGAQATEDPRGGPVSHPGQFPADFSGLRATARGRAGWPIILGREALRAMAADPTTTAARLAQVRGEDVADDFTVLDVVDERPVDVERRAGLLGRLDAGEALRLMALHDVPERGVAHGVAVGSVAAAFADSIAAKLDGSPLGVPSASLAHAAGIVHDIAKGCRRHEHVGGWWLALLGLPDLARCVRDHRDIVLDDRQRVTERELVYLADKYCRGPLFVPLERRFGEKMEMMAGKPGVVAAIRKRLAHAQRLEARLTREFGFEPASVAQSVLRRLDF